MKRALLLFSAGILALMSSCSKPDATRYCGTYGGTYTSVSGNISFPAETIISQGSAANKLKIKLGVTEDELTLTSIKEGTFIFQTAKPAGETRMVSGSGTFTDKTLQFNVAIESNASGGTNIVSFSGGKKH